MKKKAIISVLSNQNLKDNENIEVVTLGDFYKQDNFYYAVYDETQISGMEGTKTTFKISSDKLSLIREGSTNTQMEFKEREKGITLYDTPYGMLELELHTKKIDININDAGGDVFINYDISISGQKPQNTQLKINIKPKNN